MPTDSVKVAVRVRPFNQREKNAKSKCIISMVGKSTTIVNPQTLEQRTFSFDQSYWSHDSYVQDDKGVLLPESENTNYADQTQVFSDLGQGVLDNAWQGYNAALFAYGQTGSGKSYSMIGYGPNKGIVPITCHELFKAIENNKNSETQLQVTFSMLEIYNEQVRDLLVSAKNMKSQAGSRGMRVRQHPKAGFYVEGLKQVPVQSYSEIERLMEQGTVNRTTASTNMNATSSRSHMVITIKFKQVFRNATGQSTTKTSEMSLVDLAGSERAQSTGAVGDRMKEGSSINLSLSMLGNVISALAENSSGGKKKIVPYRDSILTKLLQSALGGNSKTIMIAALSPAAINYEETLSTLKYADRAKKIQNQAVINESPTDRLIRELKEENLKLMSQLKRMLSGKGGIKDDKRQELETMLEENERQMQDVDMTWDERLMEAKKEWEKSVSSDHQEEDVLWKHLPHIVNVNEDSQLSGVIKYCFEKGENVLGKSGDKDVAIKLRGLGIQNLHARVTNTGQKVTIESAQTKAEILVNGKSIKTSTELMHLDRIKLGSNNLYLYIGFPSERGSSEDEQNRYDYEFFQNEIAESSGLGLLSQSDENALDPETLMVLQDYINLLPQIYEANAISEELGKNVTFEPEVKNLGSHDSLGRPMAKEILIRLTNTATNKVWIWPKDKFINRKYLMQDIYSKWLEGEKIDLEKNMDPYWDPLEDIFIGSCHVWLNSLAYYIDSDDHLEIRNYRSIEEGKMRVKIMPCDPKGQSLRDEMMVLDSRELLGRRMDFIIFIPQVEAVKWVLDDNSRGIQCRFNLYGQPQLIKTKVVWNSGNPKLDFRKQFTIDRVSQDFLDYLTSHALVVEVWGTQAGTESDVHPSFAVSVSPRETSSLDQSKLVEQLQEKLRQKEREMMQLRREHREKRDSFSRSNTHHVATPSSPKKFEYPTRRVSLNDTKLPERVVPPRTPVKPERSQPFRRISHTKRRISQILSQENHPSSRRSSQVFNESFDEVGLIQHGLHNSSTSSLPSYGNLQRKLSVPPVTPTLTAFDPNDILPKLKGGKRASQQLRLHLPSVGEMNGLVAQSPSPDGTTRRTSLGGREKVQPPMMNGFISAADGHQDDVINFDVQMLKALKGFFKDMRDVQRKMRFLQDLGTEAENAGDNGSLRHICSKQQESIRDIDGQLNVCVKDLREAMHHMIRKKKQEE